MIFKLEYYKKLLINDLNNFKSDFRISNCGNKIMLWKQLEKNFGDDAIKIFDFNCLKKN